MSGKRNGFSSDSGLSGSATQRTLEFRDPISPGNTTLLNRFENAPTWRFDRPDGKQCALLVGPILSGEKLVDRPEFKRHLSRQFPQAIGG